MSTSTPPNGLQEPQKEIIWKKDDEECDVNCNNAEIQHVIGILQTRNEEEFLRWTDVCDDIGLQDSSGNTVLHWACAVGNLEAVTHLIFLGVELNCINASGATPLHCAAVTGKHALIMQLLRHGADATIRNLNGHNLFDLLKFMGCYYLSDLYTCLEELSMTSSESINDEDGELCDVESIQKDSLGSSELLEGFAEPHDPKGAATVEEGLQSKPLHIIHESKTEEVTSIESNSENGYDTHVFLLESTLLVSYETAGRNALIAECWEDLLELLSSIDLSDASQSTVLDECGAVEAVLGEKHCNGENERMLLVRFVGQSEGEEVWVPASRVAQCPCVVRYMEPSDHPDTTLSSTRGNGDIDLFDVADPMETLERLDLAQQLELLGHANSNWRSPSHPSTPLPHSRSPIMEGRSSHEIPPVPRLHTIRSNNINDSPNTESPQRQLHLCGMRQVQEQDQVALFIGNMSDTLISDRTHTPNSWSEGNLEGIVPSAKEGTNPKRSDESESDTPFTKPAWKENVSIDTNVQRSLPKRKYELSPEERTAYDSFLRRSALKRLKKKGKGSMRKD